MLVQRSIASETKQWRLAVLGRIVPGRFRNRKSQRFRSRDLDSAAANGGLQVEPS